MNAQLDPIERALRAPEQPLADEEFSASVLARLPPRRRRSTARRWTLAGAAALGSALTLVLAPPLENALAALSPVAVPDAVASTVALAAIVAIVTIPAVFVFFAARSDR
jgi:hypothetical protein